MLVVFLFIICGTANASSYYFDIMAMDSYDAYYNTETHYRSNGTTYYNRGYGVIGYKYTYVKIPYEYPKNTTSVTTKK